MPIEGVKINDAINLEHFLNRGNEEIRHEGQLVVSFKFAPFVCWFSKDHQNSIEKRFSHLILSAIEPSIMLHHFPRGKYEISVLILDFAGRAQPSTLGNFLAAAVTCTSLALLNTGVQMYDLPVALNFNLSESNLPGDGGLCVAVLPRLKQFSMLHSDSSQISSPNALKKLLEECLDKCIAFSDTVRSLLYNQNIDKCDS